MNDTECANSWTARCRHEIRDKARGTRGTRGTGELYHRGSLKGDTWHVRCYRRGRGHQLKAGKRWQWMLRNLVGSLSKSKPSTSTTFISSP